MTTNINDLTVLDVGNGARANLSLITLKMEPTQQKLLDLRWEA